MKKIDSSLITDTVERLCQDANYYLNDDILSALNEGFKNETSETGKDVLQKLIENAAIAKNEKMAICQDTGMAIVFIDIGQGVHVVGTSIEDAINEGVKRGYKNGYLRSSVVKDPFFRENTGDNTPAIIHYNIVPGENIKITVAPKGFGSENMSALKMLKPSEGLDGAKQFILKTVLEAGPNPCPPIVVGVGAGGSMEKAAILAKKALLRPIDQRNSVEYIAKLEEELLESINKSGIGPAGLGGRITALAVNMEVFPTHIAGLPVAVNISCHATRHSEAII